MEPINWEIELKLQVALPEEWEAICRFIETLGNGMEPERVKMEARYFDTADGDLNKHGIAYRVRRENASWTATVKGRGFDEGGLHRRLEWNFGVEGGEPDLSVLAATALDQKLIGGFLKKKPAEIVRTDFMRTLVPVKKDGALIEVALDKGIVCGAGEKSPILELELELKEGRPKDVLKLGAELSKKFCLVVEPRSKFLRGLLLDGRVRPEKIQKTDGICAAAARIAALVRREWIEREFVAAKEYERPLEIVLKSMVLTKEEVYNLTSWRTCREDEKIERQKVLLATLLLLWSEQNVL